MDVENVAIAVVISDDSGASVTFKVPRGGGTSLDRGGPTEERS